MGERHGFTSRLAGSLSRRFGASPRVSGPPPSENGASSFHLWWAPPSQEELVEASVTLTIVTPPVVPRLYFWALQVSFEDGGAGHLGLQWAADPPRRMCHVNWGGYGRDGLELPGGESALPSSFANPNTRDYDWRPGDPYRLCIRREDEGWAGRIDGRLVRHLHAPGHVIRAPVVWSEVFADCDHPAVTAHWSGLEVVTRSGSRLSVGATTTSYQDRRSGGCDNTSSAVTDQAFVQATATDRATPAGSVLRLS